MNVLHRLRASLDPGGLVIDTQPVSPLPPIEANSQYLGALDRREWARTIRSLDSQVERVIDDGLFELIDTSHFAVADEFGSGPELVEATRQWQGTSVSEAVAARIARETSSAQLTHAVRLRVLRRL